MLHKVILVACIETLNWLNIYVNMIQKDMWNIFKKFNIKIYVSEKWYICTML